MPNDDPALTIIILFIFLVASVIPAIMAIVKKKSGWGILVCVAFPVIFAVYVPAFYFTIATILAWVWALKKD